MNSRHQRNAHSRAVACWSLASSLFLGAPSAWAQDSGANRAFSITPALAVTQTYTDNRDLRAVNPQSELITQISPGIRINSRGGQLQGSLDYSLSAIAYSHDSSRNQFQNALRATLAAEVIERTAFVNASANISQQSISAFAVQSNNALAVNTNSTEVRNVSVSPSLRGKLAGEVDLEARLSYAKTTGASSNTTDSTSTTGALSASGHVGALGWQAQVNESVQDYRGGRSTTQNSLGTSLNYVTNHDLRYSLRYGSETNNVLSAQNRTTATWGLGVEWVPSPRTQVNFQADRRYFGNGHSVAVQHRLQRSFFRFSDTRDASTSENNSRANNALSYEQLDAALTANFPNAQERDLAVRTLLATQGGFLSKAVTLQRRQDASFSLQGQRLNVSLTGFQSDTRRLDGASTAVDDFSLVNRIRQHGYNFNGGYQLTPTSTVTLGYNRTSTADSGLQRGNDQRSLSVSLSTRIAMRISMSLTARHVQFDSATQPYNESGAVASFSFQF